MKTEFDQLDPESIGKVTNSTGFHKQAGTEMFIILISYVYLLFAGEGCGLSAGVREVWPASEERAPGSVSVSVWSEA